MAILATFWRTDTHHIELFDKGSDIELHGFSFSLIFLESLVYYLCSLQVNINGDQFLLSVVVFQFEIEWWGKIV